MKKIFALSLAVVLALALAACNSAPPVSDASAPPSDLPGDITPESPDAAGKIPDELTGQWSGSVDDINLSFNVESDGTGKYSFEQKGYSESYDFKLEAGAETFSVKIPEDNKLGIAKIEGTYAYSEGVLTLDVRTTFSSGRVFTYTVPCRKS